MGFEITVVRTLMIISVMTPLVALLTIVRNNEVPFVWIAAFVMTSLVCQHIVKIYDIILFVRCMTG